MLHAVSRSECVQKHGPLRLLQHDLCSTRRLQVSQGRLQVSVSGRLRVSLPGQERLLPGGSAREGVGHALHQPVHGESILLAQVPDCQGFVDSAQFGSDRGCRTTHAMGLSNKIKFFVYFFIISSFCKFLLFCY